MDRKTDKLVSAIGDIDTAYLEEALDFNRTNADRRKCTRFPKLSAACAAVLIILGVSVTAFSISRWASLNIRLEHWNVDTLGAEL